MEPSCVRQDLIPGTSKLFADFLYQFQQVSRFYSYDFADPANLREAAQRLNFPVGRRSQLVSVLREQNSSSAALAALEDPATVAIVTGQQVGLLSGPSYTIFKALTAVRIARELTAAGQRAVPIFWLASEDHDLAEVDHAWIFGPSSAPAKISVANTVMDGGPVGEVEIPEMPWDEITAALGDLPFAEGVIERLRSAYVPGATLGRGFRHLVQGLLEEFGLLFLDPLCAPVRELARPLLAQTAARLPELLEALKERDRELAASGYHSQVHIDDSASLLFLLEEGKRLPLRWKDGRFVSRYREYSAAELESVADRLSPNALLRPVMQDFLLPTVCYVGGPAEIAYMAQSQVLYQRLLGRMPVIFPRNSFTLLDARAEKLIGRFNLTPTDLFSSGETVRSKIAAQLVPPGLAGEFRVAESTITKTIASLQANLHRFDPTLEAASRKSGDKMLFQLRRLSDKTARETLHRDERSVRNANYLINSIYPHGHLQERFYSIVPFLAKHGLDLPQRLFGMTQLTCPDHMIRTL